MQLKTLLIALCAWCAAINQLTAADDRVGGPIAGKRTDMPWEAMSWTMAEGRTDAYPYLLRIRHVPTKFPRQRYPQRLNIFWAMTQADEKGYPTGKELQRLHAFEERLIGAMESDRFAILTLTLTGRREREFVFYTANPEEFIRRLTDMPQEHRPYPIKIHLDEDPKWRYYNDELSSASGS